MGKSKDKEIFSNKGKVKMVSVKSVRKEQPRKDGEGGDADRTVNDDEYGYRMKEVRNLFLQGLSAVYFIAFISVYLQADGLYGTNGITPIKAELKLTSRNPQQCIKDKFTLLCLVPNFFGIDTQHALDLVALIGTIIACVATMCAHVCTIPTMIIMWGCYFSIYQVGGVFLWFQWDTLLLEAGILGILAAPWLPTSGGMGNKPRDLTTMWMVKWLLFRLMFASGVVKLQSGCPTWWGLTALNYHFESQCLPTPLAYFTHHLPSWVLHLLVVGTYYVEIAVPFAFFAPFKSVKRFAFWTQIIFQLSIILTGNYTYFNVLTIVLCFSLLDADFFGYKSSNSSGFSASRIFSKTFSYTFIGFSLFYTGKFFGLGLNPDNTISSKITFSRIEFDWFVSITVPYAAMMGLLTLGSTVSQTLIISLFDKQGAWNKLTSFVSSLFYGALCFGLFSITLVPFTSLHTETNRSLYPVMRDLHASLAKYHVANSYGLFRKMTGVTSGRPEVVLEYADDLNGPWKEYEFLYKPGNVSAAPLFVAPHQPRLDWQMWFASLSTYHDNPWLVSLTYRLLQGEKSVIKLLDVSKAPKTVPKYIRASAYHYTFTKPSSGPGGDWWTRKRDKEYMPIFSKDHAPLVDFIKNLGYLDKDVQTPKESQFITEMLDSIRTLTEVGRPEFIVWGAIASLLAIIFSAKMFK
ncbi:lipase maturation factor 2 [Folsomia candida]|nr:lipase maturation factor 2 [Folsomia candida]XP_035714803.1 lipase maturation factor 2 [Folsomia candida]